MQYCGAFVIDGSMLKDNHTHSRTHTHTQQTENNHFVCLDISFVRLGSIANKLTQSNYRLCVVFNFYYFLFYSDAGLADREHTIVWASFA